MTYTETIGTAYAGPDGTEHGRLLYTADRNRSRNPYDPQGEDEREEVATCSLATLVSSRTDKGVHAPALDLDMPAALCANEDGFDLWVDVSCYQWRWKRAMAKLTELGLVRDTALRTDWETARAQCVNRTRMTASLAALGPTFETGFAPVFNAARSIDEKDARVVGPEMERPHCVPLTHDAVLLPSANNYHLYVQAAFEWNEYEAMLKALTSARLLEKGFVGTSVARSASYLRVPWAAKGSPRDTLSARPYRVVPRRRIVRF